MNRLRWPWAKRPPQPQGPSGDPPEPALPPGERVRRALRRGGAAARAGAKDAWRRLGRYRALRDVLSAIMLVTVLLAVTSMATGGAWPPLVVVDSGSMMHAVQDTPYGRWGTIDPGDILLLRRVSDPSELPLWVEGDAMRYGRPGAVLAFAQNGDRANITVIHRAITYVEVTRTEAGPSYSMLWLDGEVRTWGPEGIYFPPLGFDERFGFTPRQGYHPVYSGYITRGDNAFSNPAPDQVIGVSQLVHPTWVEGEVRGEIPWVGLGKLMFQSGRTNPAVPGWERVGNAYAPVELWTMFFLVVSLVILVPLTFDTVRIIREERARHRELEALARLQEAEREEEQTAPPPRKREPTEFQPVR